MSNKEITVADITKRVQTVYGRWGRDTSVEQMRNDWDQLYAAELVGAEVENVMVGDLPCRWVVDDHADKSEIKKVALYLHGGGFRMGSNNSHQDLMARLSKAAGCAVFGVDYRLGPDHQYPAALDDTLSAYHYLLDNGYEPNQIAIVGDSVGGNLVAAVLHLIRQREEVLPAAVVMMSPWLDMTITADSYQTRAKLDPIHQGKFLTALAAGYLGKSGDVNDPLVSPLFGDLAGMPPTLIQVGDHEVGLDDSINYAKKARSSGVEVELEIWDDMIHVFQLFAAELPEARQAIDKIGVFLNAHLPK